MSHPNWCGKSCSDCLTSCKLDESMSCSPDCQNLNPKNGMVLDKKNCKGCDSMVYLVKHFIDFIKLI